MREYFVPGHGNVTINDKSITKRVSSLEFNFYKQLAKLQKNDTGLTNVFPSIIKFYDNSQVEISRVGSKLKEPQVCDVKIGFQTCSPHELFINRKNHPNLLSARKFHFPTHTSYGNSLPQENFSSYKYIKKIFKMKVRDVFYGSCVRGFCIDGISNKPKFMLLKGSTLKLREHIGKDPDSYTKVLSKLLNIREIMQRQNFTFVGSSILIAIDKDKKDVDVKLVDFGHPFFKNQNEKTFKILKRNFLKGLDNLINTLDNIKKQREHIDLHIQKISIKINSTHYIPLHHKEII